MFLWWPDAKRLGALGYDSVAHVPVLFDSDWRYHNELNRYLRERALLEWSPSDAKATRHRFVSRNKYPTKRTLENIGRELANYFGWLEWRKLDWTRVSYTQHLVRGYQNDLQSGRWSLRGNPLAPSTVYIYLNSACAFEAWAAELVAGQCPAPVREQLYKILFKPDKNAPEYKAVVDAAKKAQRAPLDLLVDAGAIDSPYQFHWRRFLFEQFPKGHGFPAALAAPAYESWSCVTAIVNETTLFASSRPEKRHGRRGSIMRGDI